MKKNIFISVIVPVYGVEKYIERCAHSLFEQTIKDGIEFIFVDDATQDNSIELLRQVIKSYPERERQIRIIRHETNQGLAQARLTGISHAKGKYIVNCDSDDWVELNCLEKLHQAAKDTNYDVILYGFYVNFKNRQNTKLTGQHKTIDEILVALLSCRLENFLWNKMFHKSVYDRITPHNIKHLNMFEDVAMTPRLIQQCNSFFILEEPLYHYSQENTSAMTHLWRKEYTDNLLAVANLLNEDININNDKIHEALNVFKIRVKTIVLANSNKTERFKHNSLFPEIDLKKALKHAPLYSKILGLLLLNGHFLCADLLQYVKTQIDKYRH